MPDKCEHCEDLHNCMMRLAHARVMDKRGAELNEQDMRCLVCKRNTGGKVMASKKKDTNCDLCGQTKNCRRAHDMWVCSMCMSVASTVKKRPDVIRAAWKRFGHEGDLPEIIPQAINRKPHATVLSDLVPTSPFDRLLIRMGEIHNAKKLDYASNEDPLGNFREAERLGIPPHIGIMVRLTDKYSRACNLIRRGGGHAVKDESLEDTLLDMANYALLTLLAFNEKLNTAKQSKEWDRIERQRDNRIEASVLSGEGKETLINILTRDELAGNVTGEEPKNGTLILGKIDDV